MGDEIETGRSMGSDYWAALHILVEWNSKQTAIDDRPEPMSSPINNKAIAYWKDFGSCYTS